MAGEIRNLEDQLCSADYENQVLRDQVTRAEAKAAQVVVPQNTRRPRTFLGRQLDEYGNVIDTRTQATPSPSGPGAESAPKTNAKPKLPARPLDGIKSGPDSYQPPAEPVPPGKSDLLIPDVELGDPIPPMSDVPSPLPEFNPGKIELPDSVKVLGNQPLIDPVSIRINPGLSGTQKSDDADAGPGIAIVVEAIDPAGRVVNLSRFDIDANMSVVLLDPAKSGDVARIGKWEFGPDQIRDMLASSPNSPGRGNAIQGSSLRVVIPLENRPTSPTVIAHVRLSADEVVLQTQAEVATGQAGVANWTPRASLRR